MFVDSSAIVAMLLNESDGSAIYQRLRKTEKRWISGLVVYETVLALMRISHKDYETVLETVNIFVNRHNFIFVDIDIKIATLAVQAFGQYGKGRHKAKLNMGDCFSYACARKIKQPLLFKGNDFNQTDIQSA